MNKPIKYRSQLRYYQNQLIIDHATNKFKAIYFSMIGFIIFGFVMFIVGILTNGGFFYSLCVLIAAILLRFLPTYPQITIDKKKIFSEKEKITLLLKDLDKLDLQVRILGNRTEVLLENIPFVLQSPSDVVLITDEIERYTNLRYFKSEPVDNQTEILMFKTKKFVSLDSESCIRVNNNLYGIYIYDAFYQDIWVEILKPVFNNSSIKSSSLRKKEIPLQDVRKFIVEIHKNVGIFRNRHQIKVNIETNRGRQTIFKTNYRSPNDEISTFRSSEKIYKALKNATFINAKIEKTVLHL
ncbi:MAG: hypothetical protein AB8G11_18600 [Saprospiraceae bacterium]